MTRRDPELPGCCLLALGFCLIWGAAAAVASCSGVAGDERRLGRGPWGVERHREEIGPLGPVGDHLGARRGGPMDDHVLLSGMASYVSHHTLLLHPPERLLGAEVVAAQDLPGTTLAGRTHGVAAKPALKCSDVHQSQHLTGGRVELRDFAGVGSRISELSWMRGDAGEEREHEREEVGSE